jgi:hypothetical protein
MPWRWGRPSGRRGDTASSSFEMRIALLHPAYRPRGGDESARLVRDLGVELARRGHDVSVLTSDRSARGAAIEDGVRVVGSRRLPQPPPLRLHEDYITNAPNVVHRLARERFDLAHAFFHVDANAAQLARDYLGGPPVVFSVDRAPTRPYLVARRYRLELMDRAINRSDAASAVSVAVAEAVEWYFGRGVEVLAGGTAGADLTEEVYARVLARGGAG